MTCDTCNCDCLQQTTFRFFLIDFQSVQTDSLSQFFIFNCKLTYVTQRLLSQVGLEVFFKGAKKTTAFRKT